MIEQLWLPLPAGAACASALTAVMSARAARTDHASRVDVAWGCGARRTGALYALLGTGPTGNRVLVPPSTLGRIA